MVEDSGFQVMATTLGTTIIFLKKFDNISCHVCYRVLNAVIHSFYGVNIYGYIRNIFNVFLSVTVSSF